MTFFSQDGFKNLDTIAKIPEAHIDARMTVYGGDEEQLRTKGHVCPWWLFPLRLIGWLGGHDGLPEGQDM